MEVNWSIAAGVLSAVLGGVGYLAKRYFDLRLDAIARFHADKYGALVQVRGLLSEIDHCVLHLSKGDGAYAEPFEKYCESVRKESRTKSAVLGDDFVVQVRDATDVALKYLHSRADGDRAAWNTRLKSLLPVCDRLMSTVDLHPSRRRPEELSRRIVANR